jgi:hypothetical protein
MNLGTPTRSSAARLLKAFRDDLREARQTRAADQALERELSSYTTMSEVNDLLGSLRSQEGPDADVIRHILTRNLQQHQRPRQLAA